MNRTYRNAHCYYNFDEAIIIPGKLFTASSAEDYLNLMYGESDRHDVKYDPINADTHMVNAYRVRKSIHELVGRYFLLYKPHHVYSIILKDILTRNELADQFIKVQFYSNHMIVAVVKEKQLQLVQSFQFEITEDIIYHLSNITEQFALDASHTNVELSGMVEKNAVLHQQLLSRFGSVTFDTMEEDGVLNASVNHPLHFFTPFYKLVV